MSSNFNPYGSPAGTPGPIRPGGPKPQMPALLVVLSIFAIIAGSLGILAVLCGGFGLAMQANMEGMNQQNPDLDPVVAKQLDDIQSQQFVPNVILIALNCLIAPILITGGIGCLMRKSWGRVLLLGVSIVAIFYVFARVAVGMYFQLATKDLMLEQMKARDPNAAGVFEGAFYVGMFFGVAVALVFCAGYVWTAYYLSTASMKNFFTSGQPGQGSLQPGIQKPF